MSEFITALGLVLVIEGLFYGAAPTFAKRLAADMIHVPENVLRIGGIAAIAIGVLVVWLARG